MLLAQEILSPIILSTFTQYDLLRAGQVYVSLGIFSKVYALAAFQLQFKRAQILDQGPKNQKIGTVCQDELQTLSLLNPHRIPCINV